MSFLKANSKNKVLIFNYEFPPLGGGGGKASFCLALELARRGWEVKVITSRFKGLARKEKIKGVEIFRIPVLRRRIHQASVFEMVTYLFSSVFLGCWHAFREKPDISLAYFGIPSGPAAFFIKFIFRVPYYVLLRGGDVPGFSPREMSFYHRLTRPIIHMLWREAKGVIANSRGLQELACKSLPDLKIQTISNGVDQELFDLARPKREKSGEIKILFAGRFTPQKGVDFLLNSLPLVQSNIPKSQIWLAGDGPERKHIEKLAGNRNFEDRFIVKLLGWKDRDALYKLYEKADIFVLPSRDEGMPNALLEAMAAALPVIATKVPGSEELVQDGENGFLVNKEDMGGMARALEKLISDSTIRQQMGTAGRKLAREYSWEKIADQFIEQFGLNNQG